MRGFTLIELIVVMAIIAVLASIVIIALNPVEMIRRSSDASRIQAVSDLGRGISRFKSDQGTISEGTAWATQLRGSREIKVVPQNGLGCADQTESPQEGGYCYDEDTGNDRYMVFSRAESTRAQFTPNPSCLAAEQTYFVYSSEFGRSGVVCSDNILVNPNYGVVPQ